MKHTISNFTTNGEFDFDLLYGQMMDAVKAGLVNRQVKDDLELLDYSKQCTFDRAWSDVTRIARGLVLCPREKKVVALPLPKFFNYGSEHRECGEPIGNPRWKGSVAYEKMDGSCGICFHWKGDWHVCTRGSFKSDQALWATQFLRDNFNLEYLDTNYTAVTEIIYPTNRIVVNYGDREDLVLLAAFDRTTFEEVDFEQIKSTARFCGFNLPQTYDFAKLSDLTKHAKTLPKDEEGYVIRFASGTRVKVKGDEYCRIHKILSHHSPLTVWTHVLENGFHDMAAYKKEIPEEFWEETDGWVASFTRSYRKIFDYLYRWTRNYNGFTDKEVGMRLKHMPPLVKRFVFVMRPYVKNGIMDYPFEIGQKNRKKMFDIFRPTGNVVTTWQPPVE